MVSPDRSQALLNGVCGPERPSPIPVLLMVQTLDLGGSERQLSLLARHLDRSRFEPHVGCMRLGGVRVEELRAAGVPITCFPVQSFRSPSLLSAARQLARYIRDERIELVHTFDSPMNLFAGPVARALTQAKVVTSQRAHRQLTAPSHRHLLRLTDSLADAIVVNCRYLKDHMIGEEKAPAGRVFCCYNGIELEQFSPGDRRKPVEFQGANLVIGVVCGLRPEKDLPTLVKAFAEVRDLVFLSRLLANQLRDLCSAQVRVGELCDQRIAELCDLTALLGSLFIVHRFLLDSL